MNLINNFLNQKKRKFDIIEHSEISYTQNITFQILNSISNQINSFNNNILHINSLNDNEYDITIDTTDILFTTNDHKIT